MAKDAAELLRDALTLAPDQRAALADSLLESLDSEIDVDAEDAWRREILRRLDEIDSGAVALIPWKDAERRLWTKIRASG